MMVTYLGSCCFVPSLRKKIINLSQQRSLAFSEHLLLRNYLVNQISKWKKSFIYVMSVKKREKNFALFVTYDSWDQAIYWTTALFPLGKLRFLRSSSFYRRAFVLTGRSLSPRRTRFSYVFLKSIFAQRARQKLNLILLSIFH